MPNTPCPRFAVSSTAPSCDRGFFLCFVFFSICSAISLPIVQLCKSNGKHLASSPSPPPALITLGCAPRAFVTWERFFPDGDSNCPSIWTVATPLRPCFVRVEALVYHPPSFTPLSNSNILLKNHYLVRHSTTGSRWLGTVFHACVLRRLLPAILVLQDASGE